MKNVRLVFAVMCFSVPLSLVAQQKVIQQDRVAPETYGTTSLTYLSLSPWDFHPVDSTATYGSATAPAGIYRTNSTGSTTFQAPVRLPEGAIVSYLEMYSCNVIQLGNITSSFRGAKTDATWSSTAGPSAAIASCGITSTSITPIVVDNTTTSYTVE